MFAPQPIEIDSAMWLLVSMSRHCARIGAIRLSISEVMSLVGYRPDRYESRNVIRFKMGGPLTVMDCLQSCAPGIRFDLIMLVCRGVFAF